MNRWRWQDDLDAAREALKDEPGRFEKAKDTYVLFRYIEPTARIVFYPYRCPSASGHACRVRIEPCADKTRAKKLIGKLPFKQRLGHR